jgi:hypothetical protein
VNARVLALIAIALTGCGGQSDSEPVAGPCVSIVSDPVFVVSKVTNSSTGEVVPNFELQSIRINGIDYNFAVSRNLLRNASVQGSNVQCTTDCGFATEAGSYSFTVAAPGYRPKQVTLGAAHLRSGGNCPSVASGATVIEVSLDPT